MWMLAVCHVSHAGAIRISASPPSTAKLPPSPLFLTHNQPFLPALFDSSECRRYSPSGTRICRSGHLLLGVPCFSLGAALSHLTCKRADLSLTILAAAPTVKILRISLHLFLSGLRRFTQQKQVAPCG